ncbi:MAG: alpha/beta hydrolase [Roseovarius indicus]
MAFTENVVEGEITHDGMTIRTYDSAPHKRGEDTIVLLHGTSGSAESTYWALFPMLADGRRVVAFDFVDAEGATTEHYAAQARAVIAALCDGPVHLTGCSFGAVIAAHVAGTTPDILKSLTLIAGWIKTDIHQQLRYDVWFKLHEEKSAAMPGFMVMTAFSHAFITMRLPAEVDALVAKIGDGSDRYSKMVFNRTVDITEAVSKITTPTLVIGCTQDQMVPIYHSKLLFGAIENARFAEVPAGHAVAHERPSHLLMLIRDFIDEPERDAPGTVHAPIHA